MKKTLLTSTIFLSSLIFNGFAVNDNNNIINITLSPITHLKNIAKDETQPETERLKACQKLATFLKTKTIIPILHDIAKQSSNEDNRTKALLELCWDKNYRQTHYEKLASILEDLVQNATNEKNKIKALDALSSDQQYKNAHYDRLTSLLWDFLEKTKYVSLTIYSLIKNQKKNIIIS